MANVYTEHVVNEANMYAFFALFGLRCFKVIHLNGFTSVRVIYFYIVINKRLNELSLSLTHVWFDFHISM